MVSLCDTDPQGIIFGSITMKSEQLTFVITCYKTDVHLIT